MDSQKQQVAERVKQANNVLVTVSTNPSVDQLAACIGLTLSLNKMGKHATAVFSGKVPSTIEFLQPEKTLEKDTNSLRDFIIALDKSKADKLRYKVEDRVVKIFITPYRTSIGEKDLEFSQGDFNVDVVLALGVHNQADLDQAITSHGRILHDATVITMNVRPGGELGGINWLDPNGSSLSELAVELVNLLDRKLMDGQIATAMLTGIVAETERFSNAKTSPQTMTISAELMAVGANQQLVATKLEEPAPPPPAPTAPIATQAGVSGEKAEEGAASTKKDDGTLEITHDDKPATPPAAQTPEPPEPKVPPVPEAGPPPEPAAASLPPEPPPPFLPEPAVPEEPPVPPPQIRIDEHGALSSAAAEADEGLLLPPKPPKPLTISRHSEPPKMILEPPALGGQLNAAPTAFSALGDGEQSGLPGMPQHEIPMLGSSSGLPSTSPPPVGPTILPPSDSEPHNAPGTSFLGDQPLEENKVDNTFKTPTGETLSDLEREVHSSHLNSAQQSAINPAVNATTSSSQQPLAEPPPSVVSPVSAASGANSATIPPPNGGNGMLPQVPVLGPDDLTPGEVANAFAPTAPAPVNNNASAGSQAEQLSPQATLTEAADLESARQAVAQAIHGEASPPSSNTLPKASAQPWMPPPDTAQQAVGSAPPPAPPPMMPMPGA